MRWQGIWAGTDIFFPSQILFYIHGVPSCSRVCPGKGWELNRTNSEVLQPPPRELCYCLEYKGQHSQADSLGQGSLATNSKWLGNLAIGELISKVLLS